jgi:hypothetical protein
MALLLAACGACGPRHAAEPPPPVDTAPDAGVPDAGPELSGFVFVQVGPMSNQAKGGDPLIPQMRAAAESSLVLDPAFLTIWPAAEPAVGYFVDATLTRLRTSKKSRRTTVSCTVSMLVATYPVRSIIAVQEGATRVTSTAGTADLDAAKQDCVRAVIAGLITDKVIPMLRRKSGLDRQ